jgi:5-methylcytosine-specific restriction enzyme A
MSKQFAQQFYASKAWRDCRKQILRRDLYTCRDCFDRANEVHHIVELTPGNLNSSLALDPDNLVSLCHACHDKITKGFTGDLHEGYYFDDDGQVRKQ